MASTVDLDLDLVVELASVFEGRLLTTREDMAPFLTDWRDLWRGDALAVAQPNSTADVAAVLRWCARHGVSVVPQGGNTGLSGGATPAPGARAVVLSLARMNRVLAVDPVNGTMTVEAGCILANAQAAAAEADMLFPLSLAAEGSCTVGGNLATNAGGIAVLAYGNARELCLGLEVVTADGEIWDGLRGLRKDNTGYDLRDLFIGSEGTLGVITAAVLKLFPRPVGKASAWVAVGEIEDSLSLLKQARAVAGGSLTAFELMSGFTLELTLKHFPGLRSPLADSAPWHVLLEVSDLRSQDAANAVLEAILTQGLEAGCVSDGVIAASLSQAQDLWALRESASEAQGLEGPTIKHDVSVPISAIGRFTAEALAALTEHAPDVRPTIFGHVGDGNLHFNVSAGVGADDALHPRLALINTIVHDLVERYGGSISAEHGLGVLRRDEARRRKSQVELRLNAAIKAALDPAGIMNPGKGLS